MEIKSKPPIVIATIFVAACSILYELLLAQSLSSTMGNTILRYNLTVGLYMASLGIGALLFSRFKIKDDVKTLIDLEILLSLVGAFSPFLIILFEKMSSATFSNIPSLYQFSIYLFNHLLIIIIGFLSGIELPLLMQIGTKIEEKFDLKVLVFDYAGTIIGIILFPNFLLPHFGIFSLAIIIAFFNCMIAFYFSLTYNDLKRKIISSSIFILFLFSLIYQDHINHFIIEGIYLK